jgi:hypothetical protein
LHSTATQEKLPDRDAFHEGAARLLIPLADVVVEQVMPELHRYVGIWHPSGFMAFTLGAHPTYGSLRLHVWPRGLRRRMIIGRGQLDEIYDGDIHSHAWFITSIVLYHYRDNIYSVTDIGARARANCDLTDARQFRVFSVSYQPGAQQELITDGRCVATDVTDRRLVSSGRLHTIDPEVYHAPAIPDVMLGATLVFSSPRVQSAGPDVLVGGSSAPITSTRRVISEDDGRLASAQLVGRVVG